MRAKKVTHIKLTVSTFNKLIEAGFRTLDVTGKLIQALGDGKTLKPALVRTDHDLGYAVLLASGEALKQTEPK
jgi:hypothetical protein